MNHHLRFPIGPVALLAGVLLTSCSSTPPQTDIPPLAAEPGHTITYEVRIFDLPADPPFEGAEREILSREEGEELMKKLSTEASFSKRTAGQFGQKRTLGNLQKFVYPTAWTPPEFPSTTTNTVGSPAGSSSFPVTPATPSAFENTRLGSTVEVVGRKSVAGATDLEIQIDRKVLLGFQNYGKPITTTGTDFRGKVVPIVITENRMEKPVFSSQRLKTSARILSDQFFVIRSKGPRPPADLQFPVEAGKAGRSPDFIAFVRIARPN